MLVPFCYAVSVLWFTMFNPGLVAMCPGGSLIYSIIVVGIWCALALAAIDSVGGESY